MPDADESEYPLRSCTLEQFDTGVILHAANVVSHGYKPILIIANGNYIIELGISFFNDTGDDKRWLSFGIGNKLQNISIHDSFVMHLMDKLEIPVIESFVISMHSVSRALTDVHLTHHQIFAQSSHTFEYLPPTKPVLVEPDKRATYQAGYVWGHSIIAKQLLPSPVYMVGSDWKPAGCHSRLPSLGLSKPCLS